MIDFVDALRGSAAYNLIKHDIESGNLSHAYMVISPDGYTLKQFFALVACKLYCPNDACLDCPICSKVMNNNHADIKYFNELDKLIKVDDIAGLIEDSVITPYESNNKLYIIYSADKMNAAAQNKLLKTLEEPRPAVTIFLGVCRESAMLDTVRSRSKVLYLDRFSPEIIEAEMKKAGSTDENAALAAACSDGMLGRAREIIDNGEYSLLYDRALDILLNMKKSSDVASFMGDKALNKNNLPSFLDILSIIIRDMLVAKHDTGLIMSRHKLNEIMTLSDKFSERALSNILYLINGERKKLNVYVGNVGIIENLLFGILEVKYKCQ